MKRFTAIFGIFYLLWQVPFAADPQLVEAGWNKWNKSENHTQSTYCTDGKCTTTTTTYKHKHRDNQQHNYGFGGNYGYGGGSYYTPPAPSGSGGTNINIDIDLRPVVKGVGCLLTLGLVCDLDDKPQQTAPPKPTTP